MEAGMDLTKLKVADLKKELQKRGLATAGKRNELLERLQAALAAGVSLAEDEGDEEYDEDEILAGDDDDDSKMTPSEEAAALAATEKATATPRSRRGATVAVVTPRTGQKKLLRRTTSPSLVVPADTTTVKPEVAVAVTTPVAAKPSPKKLTTPVKKPAPADAVTAEPAKKVQKLSVDSSNKENGTAEATPEVKSAAELRAERFGIKSDALLKQNRADRFGSTNNEKSAKLSMDIGTIDVDKLKARASRFGETTAKTLTSADLTEKMKARMDRFGNEEDADTPKKDLTSDVVKATRAAKFATTPATEGETLVTEPLVSASGKTLITMGAAKDDGQKQKRAARFGA